jgi:ketosteroid isomerase-like protein
MKASEESRRTTEAAIAQSNRRFVEATDARDARAMASVYAADADFLPPNAGAMRGRAAIECFWQGGIEFGIRGLELETRRLEPGHGFAYEIGRYLFRFSTRNGAPVTDGATYLVVHRRCGDDSWERAAEIFNWNAPLD